MYKSPKVWYNSSMEPTVDYNYNQFVLIDQNKTEHIIGRRMADVLYGTGFCFTDAATHELEEAHYEEAMEHHLGADEACPQACSTGNNPI